MRALRARVYAPKSVDATENTVLTPRVGAPHGDAFQVATVQGLAGYQPYLDSVKGRAGAIDPLSKSVDVGALTLTIGDVRLNPSHADPDVAEVQRWLTAYCGDALGRWQLPACKVVVEEAIDWDAATLTTVLGWQPYFVGRTEPVAAEGLIRRGLRLKDLSTDLDQPAFEGSPHTSITYAKRARLFPLGAPSAWGPFPAQAPIPMTITGAPDENGIATITFGTGYDDEEDQAARVTTRLTRSLAWQFPIGASTVLPTVRAWVTWTSGAPSGLTQEFGLVTFVDAPVEAGSRATARRIYSLALKPLAGGAAIPALGTTGSVWLEPARDSYPTVALPIFIGDVHPVELWRDLLAGKFGQLDATTGTPDFPVAYDAAAFAALIADATFPLMRFRIEAREDSMRSFIEDEICAPCHLTYRINALGQVVPIDLRRPTVITDDITITDDDLIAAVDRARWEFGAESVGRLKGSYFIDRPADDQAILGAGMDPDISPSRVESVEVPISIPALSSRSLDLARKPHEVKSRGLRAGFTSDPSEVPSVRIAQITQQFQTLAAELDGPFGLTPAYAVLRAARGAGRPAESAVVGGWATVSARGLEDPSTCERDGARLLRIVEISDEGDADTGLERRLRCLDPGPTPTVGPPNAPTAAAVQGAPTTTSGVARFTMPLTNLPAYLFVYVDGNPYGAPVLRTAGVGATQDVTIELLTPGTAHSVTAYGLNSTGVYSATPSPAAILTTAAATSIPAPSITASQLGQVVTIDITPAVGTPSGVTWVIRRAGVEYDETLATTWEMLVPGGSVAWTVLGRKSGFDDSPVSNSVVLP